MTWKTVLFIVNCIFFVGKKGAIHGGTPPLYTFKVETTGADIGNRSATNI